MSLPNVQFTNNLGVIQFVRCLIGVTNSWEWNGRVSRHVRSISIDGHVQQGGTDESFAGISTDRTTDGKRFGDIGTLVLPWTTLERIRLNELTFPQNVWLDFVPVQAVFADEWPDLNNYTLTFFGLTIYNPRLNVPIPSRQLRDEYPNQPLLYGQGFVPGDPRVGVFRTRAGERNIDISLSGSIRITDVKLPDNLIAKLTQRAGMASVVVFNPTIPTGWPNPFSLGDAIPEMQADLNLAHVIVLSAQIVWRVEEQMAQINVQMLCPPQVIAP